MQILKLSQPKNYAVAKPMWGGAKGRPFPNVKGGRRLGPKAIYNERLVLIPESGNVHQVWCKSDYSAKIFHV
jgi:hypothetical protein